MQAPEESETLKFPEVWTPHLFLDNACKKFGQFYSLHLKNPFYKLLSNIYYMSEQTKDNIIKKVYTDKAGFGSALTTYRQILEQDKRANRNSQITQKDAKDWFFQNAENNAKPRGANS